ncbi:MAG: hypothetical protein SGPRY_003558 [Prymnesium sp.]
MQRTFPVFLKEFISPLQHEVFQPPPVIFPSSSPVPISKSKASRTSSSSEIFNLTPFQHLRLSLSTLNILQGNPPSISKADLTSLLKMVTGEIEMSLATTKEAASQANMCLQKYPSYLSYMANVKEQAGTSGVPLSLAAKAIKTVMKKVLQVPVSDSEDDNHDDTSNSCYSSSHSEDDIQPPPHQPPKASSSRSSRRHTVSLSSSDEEVSPSRPRHPRQTKDAAPPLKPLPLDRITPPNTSLIEVAKIFFSNSTIRSVAKLDDAIQDSVHTDEIPAMALRYGFALQRLILAVGDKWLSPSPPESLAALRVLREVLLDQLSSQPYVSPSSSGPVEHKIKRPRDHPSSSESDDEPDDSQARHVAKTPDAQVGAVSSEVARRLNKRAAHIHFEPHERVRDGILRAPADLRWDLARAIGSMGKVDAPVEDESGLMYLTPAVARKLASAAVAGQIKLSDFLAASRSLMGSAASDKGSLDELLREGWALAKVALLSVGSEIYDLEPMDTGIHRIQAKIHATAKAIRIDSQDLASWIKRVLETWEQQVHDFRLLESSPPSFQRSVEMHENFVARISTAAVIADRMEARLQSRMETRIIQRLGSNDKSWKSNKRSQ